MEKMLQRTPEQIGTLWQEVRFVPMFLKLAGDPAIYPRIPATVYHAASCQRSECSSVGKQRMESILNKG